MPSPFDWLRDNDQLLVEQLAKLVAREKDDAKLVALV